MVGVLGLVLYTITPPHARAHGAWSVDATQVVLNTRRWILHLQRRGGWDLNLWPLYHLGFDIISNYQLNQKFKLMVEVPWLVLYSIIKHYCLTSILTHNKVFQNPTFIYGSMKIWTINFGCGSWTGSSRSSNSLSSPKSYVDYYDYGILFTKIVLNWIYLWKHLYFPLSS